MESKEKDVTPVGKDFQVKEMNVSFSFTQNMGDYCSAKLMAGITVQPEKDLTEERQAEVYDQLYAVVFQQVAGQRKAVMERHRTGKM